MDNKYVEIDTVAGWSIERAVEELLGYREQSKLAFCNFNGINLFSDTVNLDDAYKMITGLTKSEFDISLKEDATRRRKEELEHQKNLPKLINYWSERGKEILDCDKLEFWNEVVPARLNDLYKGMELGNCLDIVKILNNDASFDEAKEVIEDQGHSGMSFGLVCAMVERFSDRGEEFVNFIK